MSILITMISHKSKEKIKIVIFKNGNSQRILRRRDISLRFSRGTIALNLTQMAQIRPSLVKCLKSIKQKPLKPTRISFVLKLDSLQPLKFIRTPT